MILIEDWLRPVKIDLKNVDKNDLKRLWMYEANILHLAAKFNPNGLFLILSHFKEHYPNQQIHQMIKDFPSMFGATPLHVAASNPDSLSTRYNLSFWIILPFLKLPPFRIPTFTLAILYFSHQTH